MELLAPAGDLKKAYYAFKYGADAIYCGIPTLSLRTKANFFTEEDIVEIIHFAHEIGKKVYVTVNGFPHQNLLEVVKKHLQFLNMVKPDAIIIADTGVLEMANKICPDVEKHLSVQTTTLNVPGIRFWQKNKITRVILAREVTLQEIKLIKKHCPEMEIEIFVHGAMCMSYSGRCLISNYLTRRDANKGVCAHSCRWNYRIYDESGHQISMNSSESKNVKVTFSNNIKEKNIHDFEHTQYWEEELRPHEFIRVEEDFHGSHIMSSRDMAMIEYLNEIEEAGVCSLKIEGRNKTIYYLATVCRAYRKALDDLVAGKSFDPTIWDELHAVANRGFFTGFLNKKPNAEGQQYEANTTKSTHKIVGIVLDWKEGMVRFEVKNRIDEGDKLTFMFPKLEDDFSIKASGFIKNEDSVQVLHGGDGDGWMKCPKKVPAGILIRKKIQEIKTKNFAKKENR